MRVCGLGHEVGGPVDQRNHLRATRAYSICMLSIGCAKSQQTVSSGRWRVRPLDGRHLGACMLQPPTRCSVSPWSPHTQSQSSDVHAAQSCLQCTSRGDACWPCVTPPLDTKGYQSAFEVLETLVYRVSSEHKLPASPRDRLDRFKTVDLMVQLTVVTAVYLPEK